MNNKPTTPKVSTDRLTIGTPYGLLEVELKVCGDHFSFRFLSTPPALHTRAAEPFLYRLFNTLPFIGEAMWADFPPEEVQVEIAASVYQPDTFCASKASLN
jgi:hypothetical protein